MDECINENASDGMVARISKGMEIFAVIVLIYYTAVGFI